MKQKYFLLFILFFSITNAICQSNRRFVVVFEDNSNSSNGDLFFNAAKQALESQRTNFSTPFEIIDIGQWRFFREQSSVEQRQFLTLQKKASLAFKFEIQSTGNQGDERKRFVISYWDLDEDNASDFKYKIEEIVIFLENMQDCISLLRVQIEHALKRAPQKHYLFI